MAMVSKYFSESELNCKCSKCKGKPIPPKVLVNLKIVCLELDEYREEIGKPIHVDSAYRCKEHNKAIGGVENSAHIFGYAIDVNIDGMTSGKMFEMFSGLNSLQAGRLKPKTRFKGVGLYPNSRHFCHVDMLPNKPRPNTWKG